jgi:hypothetical protein
VQLYQLTPNSILHIACFVTLCESFLGIEPHWILWKFLFRIRPSVSLSKKPEISLQADPVSATSEAPEADESQDRDDAEVLLEKK